MFGMSIVSVEICVDLIEIKSRSMKVVNLRGSVTI